MNKLICITLLVGLAALSVACSSGGNETATAPATTSASPAATTSAEAPKADEVPTAVKAIFPNAQSFTKQHKDLTTEQIASLEKMSGQKLDDKDFHSFAAFSTAGGARKQVGVATLVKGGGMDMLIAYGNVKGQPVINEVKSEGMPAPFLAQFKGKGHDNKLKLGEDIKALGADEAMARSMTDAIRLNAMTMQTLYGSSHEH